MDNNNPNGTVADEQATLSLAEIEALRAKAQEAEDISKRYKDLQAEFTRRNQTKSRGNETQEEDDGVKNANEYLKTTGSKILKEDLGFVSKDDLEAIIQSKLQEVKDLEKLDKFPTLAPQRDAILQLSKVDWLSIEETIKKYKFIDDESMENFHKPLVGQKKKSWTSIDINNPSQEDLELIKKMSPEEFNKFIAS